MKKSKIYRECFIYLFSLLHMRKNTSSTSWLGSKNKQTKPSERERKSQKTLKACRVALLVWNIYRKDKQKWLRFWQRMIMMLNNLNAKNKKCIVSILNAFKQGQFLNWLGKLLEQRGPGKLIENWEKVIQKKVGWRLLADPVLYQWLWGIELICFES